MKRELSCYLKSKVIKHKTESTEQYFIDKYNRNRILCPKDCLHLMFYEYSKVCHEKFHRNELMTEYYNEQKWGYNNG